MNIIYFSLGFIIYFPFPVPDEDGGPSSDDGAAPSFVFSLLPLSSASSLSALSPTPSPSASFSSSTAPPASSPAS